MHFERNTTMDTKKIDSQIDDLAKKAKEGGHRLQEAAEKAAHSVEEVAVKAAHTAQEAAQRVIDRAKEAAAKTGTAKAPDDAKGQKGG
jgi:hypothetical protein